MKPQDFQGEHFQIFQKKTPPGPRWFMSFYLLIFPSFYRGHPGTILDSFIFAWIPSTKLRTSRFFPRLQRRSWLHSMAWWDPTCLVVAGFNPFQFSGIQARNPKLPGPKPPWKTIIDDGWWLSWTNPFKKTMPTSNWLHLPQDFGVKIHNIRKKHHLAEVWREKTVEPKKSNSPKLIASVHLLKGVVGRWFISFWAKGLFSRRSVSFRECTKGKVVDIFSKRGCFNIFETTSRPGPFLHIYII